MDMDMDMDIDMDFTVKLVRYNLGLVEPGGA
jgi:hypothetical protein